MSYHAFQPTYTRAPPIYNDTRAFDMERYTIPLSYHHQPPSPDDSPSSSPASGTNFGHHDTPMGQTSGIAGYDSPPYPPAQTFGQGFPSSVEQGFGTFQGPQSVMRHSQFMPTQPHTDSHPPPSDYYTTPEGENMERYVNFPPDDSRSPALSPSASFDSRRGQEPPRPTDQETEAYLRKSIPIPEGKQVNLWSLPDSTKPPKISDMIKLAIWGSRNHQLTLRQIYEEIEHRYPQYKDAEDKPWQRSIRHNLSLKAMFIREERPQSDPGKGYYWTLNVAMGEGNKRDRKRKRDGQNIKEEEEDTDFSSGHSETAHSPPSSQHWPPPHHRPDNTHQAMHMSANNPQQGMMHGQIQYTAPLFHGTMLNQTAPGGLTSYNASMGHPGQNISFQGVHPGNAYTQNSAWAHQPVLNSQAGPIGVGIAPGITQDHYHHQQDVGSSHQRHPTGGMGTRSQQQVGRMSHNMISMQRDFGSPMEGVSQSSSKSSRRPHEDTSPEADVDERARSRPRQRS